MTVMNVDVMDEQQMNDRVDREEAMRRALALLKNGFGDDLHDPDVGEIVVQEAVEYENAWGVPFNSRRFLEADDFDCALLPNLIVVPKDGPPAHYPPTAIPLDEYFSAVADGRMPWLRP